MENFNEKELELLDKLILTAIKNGNSVTKISVDPTPDEYGRLYDIHKKLGLNK